MQLSNSIQGIITQELLPKIGGGRVPSCEIMFINDAIRSLIRENKNPSAIIDQMQTTSRTLGSQTKEQSLANLVVNGLIDVETATRSVGINKVDYLKKMIVSMSK
ncbi:MAG TPA: hypothetical protein GXZ90_10835 [Clostridiales bacterium]|nr:hypothetical protein [Clostridiales bacterium]